MAGAPVPSNMKYSAKGRTWLIVIRGPRGMAFDRWLVKRTGFSLVTLQFSLAGRFPYKSTLLLQSVGAKTGELREAALPYVRHGDDLIVVGSKGGGPINPGWVENLRRHPLCWLYVRRRRRAAVARVAEGAEWDELYYIVCAERPNVVRYHERATTFGRRIPLVVLSPYRPDVAL